MNNVSMIKEGTGANGIQYRVVLELDESPHEPYDDGSVPLWKIERSHVEQVKMTSFDVSDVRMSDVVAEYGTPGSAGFADIERWLKIWHGNTVVETWHHGNYWYIAADTEQWREAMGVTAEQVKNEAEQGSLMAEYKAWAEGDVYGYMIERLAVEYTTVADPERREVISVTEKPVWIGVEVDCWGLYGRDYAVATATKEFDAFLTSVQDEGR